MLDYEAPMCPSRKIHEVGRVHGPGSLRVRPAAPVGTRSSHVWSEFSKSPAHSEAGTLLRRGGGSREGQGHRFGNGMVRDLRVSVPGGNTCVMVDLGSDDPDSPRTHLSRVVEEAGDFRNPL